ncbi:MAG: DUF4097 domain-containing protein [Eubacteriaceae bacterium]|nr:DUF4097 domain-containing protein [Eubacteriaceae bacterium]
MKRAFLVLILSVLAFSGLVALLCFAFTYGFPGGPIDPTFAQFGSEDWLNIRQIVISSESARIEFLESYSGQVEIGQYYALRKSIKIDGQALYISVGKDIDSLVIRLPDERMKYDIYIRSTTGACEFKSLSMGNVHICTVNASAYFSGVDCDTLVFMSIYSDVYIANSRIHLISIESHTGDAHMRAAFREAKVYVRYGNLYFTPLEEFSRISIRTICGNANLNLPAIYGYYLELKSTKFDALLGDFDFEYRKSYPNIYLYGDESITINAETLFGSIIANKEKPGIRNSENEE